MKEKKNNKNNNNGGIQTPDVGVRHPLLFGLPDSSSHSPYHLNTQNRPREDKGDREGILRTHPIPYVIRLELFLESG